MRLYYIAIVILVSVLAGNFQAFAQSQNQQSQNQVQQQNQVQTQQQAIASRIAPEKTMAPDWYATLSDDHKHNINLLLDYWQKKSAEVKRYQCDFVRYDYDTSFCNWRDSRNGQLAAASIMTGEIRFASPDRAYYQTEQVFDFEKPPEQEGQDPSYKPRSEVTQKEKWICDGNAIYEFDFQNKKLYETVIPAEMQGKGLVNSPLPFLFGASRTDILDRFWVRIATPDGVTNEYWLEAFPKKIEDARNYKKLELVLSRDELFLPIMMHIYAPNYNPKENNLTSRVFEFKNRQVNGGLAAVKNFLGFFVRPRLPMGFERVKRNGLQANPQFDPARLQRPAQAPGKNPIR